MQDLSMSYCLVFSGKGGAEGKEYEVTLEFYQEVNPEVRGHMTSVET